MSIEDQDNDPLDLESLDPESLLIALTRVEKAIPDLLLDVKPVLAHLVSPATSAPQSDAARAEDAAAMAARGAVERYMATLDKIQFILRQTVYYLRETRAAPSTLRPPAADALPRPLAATLRQDAGQGQTQSQVRSQSQGQNQTQTQAQGNVTLGIYGARTEVAALRDLLASLQAMRAGGAARANDEGGDDGGQTGGHEGEGEGDDDGDVDDGDEEMEEIV